MDDKVTELMQTSIGFLTSAATTLRDAGAAIPLDARDDEVFREALHAQAGLWRLRAATLRRGIAERHAARQTPLRAPADPAVLESDYVLESLRGVVRAVSGYNRRTGGQWFGQGGLVAHLFDNQIEQ